MLGIFPAPKAATGEGRNASSRKDTMSTEPMLSGGVAILNGISVLDVEFTVQ